MSTRRWLVTVALGASLLAGCGDTGKAETPSQPVMSQSVTPLTVTGKRVDPATTSTTGGKRECARYKTTSGKRRCAEYKTTPKSVTTDDQDYVLTLSDGREVDVDESTYNRYSVGGVYP